MTLFIQHDVISTTRRATTPSTDEKVEGLMYLTYSSRRRQCSPHLHWQNIDSFLVFFLLLFSLPHPFSQTADLGLLNTLSGKPLCLSPHVIVSPMSYPRYREQALREQHRASLDVARLTKVSDGPSSGRSKTAPPALLQDLSPPISE